MIHSGQSETLHWNKIASHQATKAVMAWGAEEIFGGVAVVSWRI